MGFYDVYSAVFDAVKDAVETKSSIKTVVLGEQFTMTGLPKAIINALPCPVAPASMDELLEVRVNFSVVIVIQEYAPKDWFDDIITVMADIVDAILEDRTLGGAAGDCFPTSFSPGEIKFQDKLFYGGQVGFQAVLQYEP